jgi:flagellar basal-body rod protein FlgF
MYTLRAFQGSPREWRAACNRSSIPMDPLTITAASGLRSRMESLDMLANNLANAATSGYKKDSESYSLYMSAVALAEGADADPVTAALPVIERNWTDFSQGVIQDTGSPLDLALSGEGFFAVQGKGGPLYTRSGHFQVTADGNLATTEGYPVLLNDGTTLQPDALRPLQISASGVISQSGQELGQLSIVRFDTMTALSKAGGAYYKTLEQPRDATGAEVLQGKLEGSNVSTPESAVRLINVMRQFEMLTKVVQINAEMNRKATEEVAKPVS